MLRSLSISHLKMACSPHYVYKDKVNLKRQAKRQAKPAGEGEVTSGNVKGVSKGARIKPHP
jgi:hypothetical protein